MTIESTRPRALITGASAGIGAEFARALATEGFNLALVARRKAVLEQLGQELTRDCGVECLSIECDLAREDFMATLGPSLSGIEVGLLVNNAGFSNTGDLVENDLARELELLHLNCRAPLILAHQLGRTMKGRGRGGIIFLSSTVGLVATPTWANYSASKAYALFLGEAMHEELRPYGIDVLAVCPGGTRSEFQIAAHLDLDRMPRVARSIVLEPRDVVRTALASLGSKASVVVGWGNAITAFSGRVMPRRLNTRIMGTIIRGITAE